MIRPSLVPLVKQLPLQAKQLGSELIAGTEAFSDGDKIADQVRPAQLALLGGQVVVGREAIAHHNPAIELLPSSSMAAAVDRLRPWMNTVTTALTMTHCQPRFSWDCCRRRCRCGRQFVDVGHRLLTGTSKGFLYGLLQHFSKVLADSCNHHLADFHP